MFVKFEEKSFARGINQNINLSEFLRQTGSRGLALAGLVLFFPVMLSCALIVRVSSPGSILFRQKRVGQNGKVFTLYKFRTMTTAEGLPITADNDSRITRLGRILRKSKLDELPELYNVLRGDMAFVGPRPEVVELVDLNNPLWREVLRVRPGITDPITLEFRNEESLLAVVEDKKAFYSQIIQPYKLNGYLRYLKTKSFMNDLKVIFQTFKVILLPQTAPAAGINKSGDEKQNESKVWEL